MLLRELYFVENYYTFTVSNFLVFHVLAVVPGVANTLAIVLISFIATAPKTLALLKSDCVKQGKH